MSFSNPFAHFFAVHLVLQLQTLAGVYAQLAADPAEQPDLRNTRSLRHAGNPLPRPTGPINDSERALLTGESSRQKRNSCRFAQGEDPGFSPEPVSLHDDRRSMPAWCRKCGKDSSRPDGPALQPYVLQRAPMPTVPRKLWAVPLLPLLDISPRSLLIRLVVMYGLEARPCSYK